MSGAQLMVLKQPYATAHTYQVNSQLVWLLKLC